MSSVQPPSISPATTVGAVRLRVADLERARSFYERVIGLRALDRDEPGVVALGAGDTGAGDDERAIVELVGDEHAPPRLARSSGLFHLAILMPSRAELARSLLRLVRGGWRLGGASDHLVSEALYLSDPEGNGIELYRDRPREEWPWRDGELQMATLPLDLDSLVGELDGQADAELGAVAPGTRMGHVHLQVADLGQAERFYNGVLGLEVMVRAYPGALFFAAGGYHHHVGTNTWNSAGAPAPPAGALGLDRWELVLPDASELERLSARLRAASLSPDPAGDDAALIADPSGNRVLLRVAGRSGTAQTDAGAPAAAAERAPASFEG